MNDEGKPKHQHPEILKMLVQLPKRYAIAVATIGMFLILTFSSPAFLSFRNVHNIIDQSAHVGIVACAHTLAIISGNFDLSSGAIFALGGCVAAMIASWGYVRMAFIIPLALGFGIGLVNGLIVSVLRLNSFIATLATGFVISGFALVMTKGRLVIVNDPSFMAIGQGTLFSIRMPIYIFAVFAIITWILLSKTTFGRHVYAVGGNAEAARLSGVNVRLVHTLVFALTGLAAALAGVITVSRIGQGQADIGGMIPLQAIARVVIGGTSVLGGQGTVGGTVFGVLLLRLVGNGFNLLNVSPFYQQLFEGLIILLAINVESLSRRGRGH